MYKHQFTVGRYYLTREGKPVKIIAENDPKMWPHYRCVQGDDTQDQPGYYCEIMKEWVDPKQLGWRYDRPGPSEVGRCTGGETTNPRNLVPGSDLVFGVVSEASIIGAHYITRFGDSFLARGVHRTALNAKKQGVPIEVVQRMVRLFYGVV